MLRAVAFCLTLCYSCFALAQSLSPRTSSDPQSPATSQVVYVIDGSTLTTYNVDPQTFQATQVGTLRLPESVYPGLLASPNGHFIYYTAYLNYSQQGHKLYVYETNPSGVPQNTPVQTLKATGLSGLSVDPASNFLYAVYVGQAGAQTTPYVIRRYVMSPTTGKISQPVTEAKYELASGAGGGELCSLAIPGVADGGTIMYDEILCSFPGGASATYNQRTVNTQTGALGPDVQIYSWNNASGGGENVQFVNRLMFDFVIPNNFQQDVNLLNVYQVQPNVSTPLISCGTSMLAACGDFIQTLAHPSGKYVFLTDPSSVANIGQMDLQTKQITETSSIPYEVQQFSPDGTIAYGVNDVNGALDIEIYGFSVATGAVTPGGTISVPSDLDSWFAAERR